MGKTKIATIDDSATEEKIKKAPMVKKPLQKGEDSLVAQLKEELGMTEPTPVIASEAKQSTQESAEKAEEPKKKSQKPGKAKPRSKKYQEISEDLDRTKAYPLNEALDLVKKLSMTKFTGTLETHINTISTGMRGLVSLPFASGKKLRIVVFGGEAEGATTGTEATIDEISKGKLDFDLVITHPTWMPKLAKAAKILGPRGLMPNPKNGTIATDLEKAVSGFAAGKTEYKTESKAAVIHLAVGKLNQPNEELAANIKVLLTTLGKSRYKKVTLSPTMGPGVKLDLASI